MTVTSSSVKRLRKNESDTEMEERKEINNSSSHSSPSIPTNVEEQEENPKPLISPTCPSASPSHKVKNKRSGTKHIDPTVLCIRRKIQQCCSENNLKAAMDTFHQALQEKVKIEAQTFYNLLNLCDGLGSREIHIGTPKPNGKGMIEEGDEPDGSQVSADGGRTLQSSENNEPTDEEKNNKQSSSMSAVISPVHEFSNQQRKEFAFNVKSIMDDLRLPLVESAYTALIRILCRTGDLHEADELLRQSRQCQQCKPKLRLYTPLLVAFCENGDMIGSLHVWELLSTVTQGTVIGGEERMQLGEREYCSLMKCATRVGDIRVMDRIFSDLAEDILIPSWKTTETIVDWFQSKHAIRRYEDPNNETGGYIEASALDHVSIPENDVPSLGPIQYECRSCQDSTEWEISRGCLVDARTGKLVTDSPHTVKLLPVSLTDKAWRAMIYMNENLVLNGEVMGMVSEYAGGGKGRKRPTTDDLLAKRLRQWNDFKQFLEQQTGIPEMIFNEDHKCKITDLVNGSRSSLGSQKYDFVIDGANVGYYKQNFANAPKHVDYMQIDWLVDHLAAMGKNVLLILHERHFAKNLMPTWAQPIARKWKNAGILYCSPVGSNDDWFWMHAALWCPGTLVVSNDEMRDHYFQMLAYRSFIRWKERHQVHFSFGAWIDNGRRRSVELHFPQVYSRRIQRVGDFSWVIPLPMRGDQNRFLDGSHTADDTCPTNETYVWIHLKERSTE